MDENDRTAPTGAERADGPTAPAPVPPAAHAEARLRAADPAAGAVPDVVALRAAVDAARAEAPAADELAARRARRWTGWPARVAGVAAAALLVGGGGGYAVGTAGAEPEPAADVITAGGSTSQVAPEMGAPVPGQAPMQESDARSGVATDMMWSGWGRTVFTSSGLSTDGGSHAAWGFDPAAVVTQEAVTAAAAALGVAGEPQQVGGAWTVGPNDGSAATVSINPDGTASLGYWDPSKDPFVCPAPETMATEDAPASDGGGTSGSAGTEAEERTEPAVVPEPEPCQTRDVGAAPQGDAATAVLRDALTALGIDPAGYEMVVESYDPAWTSVTGHQVLDGQRTGVTWTASLTGAGLQGLYGALAPVVELGDYPVVSPAEAVERLGDPRFGNGWSGPVRYLEGEGGAATSMPVEPVEPTVPGTPEPGAPIAWPVEEVTIVDARLGSALHTLPDGAAALLPTYELVSADGGVWTVLAVADDSLDMAPVR